ncbi:hypothetical protein [Chitinophaga sp. 212800010-3]|uniref:hypothetical protein n=1 Tax=unclassified Chitinophaga TaxID=2619133 RepID=UPI002DF700D4|nr:DUF695 domain-containing protein [Chitinophaga sp. 212800010-3]
METSTLERTEIFHTDFNLDKKDNLHDIPENAAVFGIFAIVDNEPVNCRYIGYTKNLRLEIRNMFENPSSEGLKHFMQGPWIQLLMYELKPIATEEEIQQLQSEWEGRYKPNIDADGEYPGYYDY